MAITPYATPTEFFNRYDLEVVGVNSAEVNDTWLPYGAVRINEALGKFYTLPFSSNNATANDLNIQFSYLGVLLRTRNIEDSDELEDSLDKRIKALTTGNGGMSLDDGALLSSNSSLSKAWSSTEDYKGTFDMRQAEDQSIDKDLIQDEWDSDL